MAAAIPRHLVTPETAVYDPMPLAPLPEEPLVSILIPCYNYGRYVGEAIASACGQTYKSIEVIVCDDGSTDDSWEMIRKAGAADARVRIIRQPNSGQGAALNRCYAESRGEIVCLLDADDIFLPTKVELTVAAFRNHPQGGFAGHPILLVSNTGSVIGQKPLHGKSPHGWFGPALVRSSGMLGDISPSSAIAFRRDVASRLFPIPEAQFRRNGEGYLLVQAPLATFVIGLREALSKQRIHDSNMATGKPFSPEAFEASAREARILWVAQLCYLQHYEPRLCADLGTPDQTLDYLQRITLRLKIARDPAWRESWRSLRAHPDFAAQMRHRRWFWRIAPLFPASVFRQLYDVTCRPGLWKALWLKLTPT